VGASQRSRKGPTDDTAAGGKATNGADTDSADISRIAQKRSEEQHRKDGAYSLLRFAARVDGWARIAPDGEMKTVFIKWKWTKGPFAGCYIMVNCHYTQLLWGFDLLEQKLEEVELGVRRPVIDSYYQQT
jgi:hypothetical protein